MAEWARKYDERERAAVEEAFLAKPRPAREICERAERGELTYQGELVPAFKIPGSTVRDIGTKAMKRARGEEFSKLVNVPHVDAVEVLRRRMIALTDGELKKLESMGRAPVDLERMRKLGRVLRELAALPDPSTARPSTVGRGAGARSQDRAGTDLGASIHKALEGAAPATDSHASPDQEALNADREAPGTASSEESPVFAGLDVSRRLVPAHQD